MNNRKNDKNHKNGRGLNIPAKKLPTMPKHKKDWRHSFHWRVFRIMAEFVDGFQFLADFKKTVTFFGSARFTADHQWYKEAEKLAKMLSHAKFSIVSGGGPGIMEAANRGAFTEQGDSIGLNIKLPYEQRINPYVKKAAGFHYFFTRKVMLAYSAQAYVFFPGGYGTIDELFEILTLIQTHKINEQIPIVLVGKNYWSGMDKWLKDTMIKGYKTIDLEDLQLFSIVNTAEEAFQIIKKSKPRNEF
ncbi:MAG: TIGR00730 family Rossman fold protein [Candidatus Niyogibacteria bacterium]|nr:TIGR00730 family Rossman fold protein [Candidatus Niyogibacteria bacterium]